ncbi:hypothetical protein JCM8208_007208 [Rhodotorula glutinis]
MASTRTPLHWRLRFKPGEALDWSASTNSPAMRHLVDRREVIFAEQRKANIPHLQALSDNLVENAVGHVERVRHDRDLSAYKRFCAAAHVPPYPVTHAMIALVIFARSSSEVGEFRTFIDMLRHTKRVTDPVWAHVDSIKDMLDVAGHRVAFDAFLLEHRRAGDDLRQRHNGSVKGKLRSAVGRRRVASHVSEAADPFDGTSEEDEAAECAQVDTPGLPQPGDAFSTVEAGETAVACALLQVYGMSARTCGRPPSHANIRCDGHQLRDGRTAATRCGFLVRLEWDEAARRWVVDGDGSSYEHSHPPDARIIADPGWRPLIKRPSVRRMLGMNPLEPSRRSKKRKAQALIPSSDGEDDEDDEDMLDERHAGDVDRGRARRIVMTAPGSSRTKRVKLQHEERPAAFHADQPSNAPRSFASHDLPFRRPHVSLCAHTSTLPPLLAGSDLSAFLHSLGPSLAALSPFLAAAGVDSVDALVALISLEPTTLRVVIDHLRLVVHPVNKSRPSVVQLKLLKKRLEEERVGLGVGRRQGWEA